MKKPKIDFKKIDEIAENLDKDDPKYDKLAREQGWKKPKKHTPSPKRSP